MSKNKCTLGCSGLRGGFKTRGAAAEALLAGCKPALEHSHIATTKMNVLKERQAPGRAELPPLEGPLGTASLWKILKSAVGGSVM